MVSTFINHPNIFIPRGLAFDNEGNLFLAEVGAEISSDTLEGGLFKIDSSGNVTPFATNFDFDRPSSMVFNETDGFLYVGDTGLKSILQVSLNGSVNVFATGITAPYGLAFGPNGDLFVADLASNNVIKISGFSSPNDPTLFPNDVMHPTGAVHAHDNMIWPPNNKMVTVTLDGYIKDELSIARDGEGIGVSSAYLLVDGEEIVLLGDDINLLDEAGYFSLDIEVQATKDAEYLIELYADDTNSEEDGGPNSGLIDSTYIRVFNDSQTNADLNLKHLKIKMRKKDGKTNVDIKGKVYLPDLDLSGETVESRTTIELLGILPDGSDLVILNESTLKVKDHKKHVDIKKKKKGSE